MNKKPIKMHKREFCDAMILNAEVGTTGFCGGDGGHGGHTIIKLECNNGGIYYEYKNDDSLMIDIYGDAELRTIIKALRFILETLEKKTKQGV